MPLTEVVQYFNEHLPVFHPQAQLGRSAGFECIGGRVSARIAGYRLYPRQAPVLSTSTGAVFGWSAKVLVESASGRRVTPETLYVQAWDSEDVIFLDRFLRTLNALHHLSRGEDRFGLLAMDVHLRHVAALPEQHGQVFETLLHRLGLSPRQIVLRLSGAALQDDHHVRAAALSFAHRGYGLLAARPAMADTDWALLQALGVAWVTPDAAAWGGADEPDLIGGSIEGWMRQARAHGIGVWLDGVGNLEAIARASAVGADLFEGALWEPVARPVAGTWAGRQSVEAS
ncbi:MAG TPA: EAL domain-containing protein [Lamprocystis sp. (in: g-proteobacteria)]|nr:EAL domain-containing protein [Lamprocystis sp. (in: g-proteobacteria)]